MIASTFPGSAKRRWTAIRRRPLFSGSMPCQCVTHAQHGQKCRGLGLYSTLTTRRDVLLFQVRKDCLSKPSVSLSRCLQLRRYRAVLRPYALANDRLVFRRGTSFYWVADAGLFHKDLGEVSRIPVARQ